MGFDPTFVASGVSHRAGSVPDPGSTAGTDRFLREDAAFAVPLPFAHTKALALDFTPTAGVISEIVSYTPPAGTYLVLAQADIAAVTNTGRVSIWVINDLTHVGAGELYLTSGHNGSVSIAPGITTCDGSTPLSFVVLAEVAGMDVLTGESQDGIGPTTGITVLAVRT